MTSTVDRAREAARNFLEEHWADPDGVVTFPVDPVQIASRLDIHVIKAGLDDETSGLLVRESSTSPTQIFLNRGDGEKRQRFTCAHELGHFAKRQDSPPDKLGFVDSRDDLARRGTDPEEIFANAFAAELLMPGVAVRKWWGEGMSVAKIARIFDVSQEAMQVRLSSLGLS